MVSTQSIKQGITVNFKNQPWVIIATQFVNPGKGAAFTKAKMRNLKTGQVLENTFKSGESVELADVERKKAQFLYEAAGEYFFMDNENYDQFQLQETNIGDAKKFLIEETECYILYIDGQPVSIQLPPKMDLKVVETTPGVKGDTATGGSKDCILETGAVVKTPLFIKEGELIKVNTETGDYISRA